MSDLEAVAFTGIELVKGATYAVVLEDNAVLDEETATAIKNMFNDVGAKGIIFEGMTIRFATDPEEAFLAGYEQGCRDTALATDGDEGTGTPLEAPHQ